MLPFRWATCGHWSVRPLAGLCQLSLSYVNLVSFRAQVTLTYPPVKLPSGRQGLVLW